MANEDKMHFDALRKFARDQRYRSLNEGRPWENTFNKEDYQMPYRTKAQRAGTQGPAVPDERKEAFDRLRVGGRPRDEVREKLVGQARAPWLNAYESEMKNPSQAKPKARPVAPVFDPVMVPKAEEMPKKEKAKVKKELLTQIKKDAGAKEAKTFEGWFSPRTEDAMLDLGMHMMANRRQDFLGALGEAGIYATEKDRAREAGKASGALEARKVASQEKISNAQAKRVVMEEARYEAAKDAIEYRFTDPKSGNLIGMTKSGKIVPFQYEGKPIKGPVKKNPMLDAAIALVKAREFAEGGQPTLDEAMREVQDAMRGTTTNIIDINKDGSIKPKT